MQRRVDPHPRGGTGAGVQVLVRAADRQVRAPARGGRPRSRPRRASSPTGPARRRGARPPRSRDVGDRRRAVVDDGEQHDRDVVVQQRRDVRGPQRCARRGVPAVEPARPGDGGPGTPRHLGRDITVGGEVIPVRDDRAAPGPQVERCVQQLRDVGRDVVAHQGLAGPRAEQRRPEPVADSIGQGQPALLPAPDQPVAPLLGDDSGGGGRGR